MTCKNCNYEIDNISGLKFCPFCGTNLEDSDGLKVDQDTDKVDGEEIFPESEVDGKKEKIQDTLKMPVITKEDIRKYKREQFYSTFVKPYTKIKVVIPIVTVFLVIAVGVFGYVFLLGKSVDEERIKADLVGKVLTLPKGTNIEIKKGYIKNLGINSRNTSKSEKKDDIKAAITINNGTIEVSTLLSIQYIYEGKNKWTMGDNMEFSGETTVKPLIGMDEKLFLENLKKSTITVGDTAITLGGENVKTLQIAERKPDLDKFEEEVLVEVSIDNGMLEASGKLKCKLSFENEVWNMVSLDKNSAEDFALVLSSAFTSDKIIQIIKKEGLEETVTNVNVFEGKGFYVKDSFTKSFSISDRKYDAQKGTLIVSVKRENTAGELKTTLLTDYTLSLTFSKMELLKKSKTTVSNVAIDDMSRDLIVSSISNVEIEGDSLFFWRTDNHKITSDEAKTFKADKILSKKGLQNIRYVYGSITYLEGKKEVKKSFVVTYYLVYDGSRGYSWKLSKIIGEDSPNYKNYVPDLR